MLPKVVLYNPKAVFWTMPLALTAIGSALDRNRYRVVIVDGRLDPPESLLAHLEDALCLGMTVLTGAPLKDALAVGDLVAERFPNLPIVWGGWHPSLFPALCARRKSVTAAVTGQGEETFAEILGRLAEGKDLSGVPGCVFRNPSGEVHANPPRPLQNINAFPAHDFGLFDVSRYFEKKERRQLDYISSQGCRFRCHFCADPAVYRRGWFGYEPERVVDELRFLWSRYGFTDLAFQDETFFTQRRRVAQIAEGFLKHNLTFTWAGTMRADQGRRLDEETFALCRRSGLRQVIVGLEAGAQTTIDAIEKDIKIEDMWLTAERLVKHGIGAVINVIVGFPDESTESVNETLRVARELRKMSSGFQLSVFYFKPYPGNPIADRLGAQGYRFPATLEEWGDFDYIGSGNPWLSPVQIREIESFKFYQAYAYDERRSLWRWPLKRLSRWRVERPAYGFPWEKAIIQRMRPSQPLS